MGQTWSDDEPGESLQSLELYFENHYHLLKPISHKLFDRFVVRPYGVLGTDEKAARRRGGPWRGQNIDAVIVDSAGGKEISLNTPERAKGSSKAIYEWLGLKKFPMKVYRRFSTAHCQEDLEGLAKYHQYGEGQHVIHTVGPVLRGLEQSIRELTTTYMAIFVEYATALGANVNTNVVGSPTNATAGETPSTLRLLPIASGALLENKHLKPYMGRIFWSSVAIALERLPQVMQQSLQEATIEVCIFRAEDAPTYRDALFVVADAHQVGDDLGRIADRHGSYEWVRTENRYSDRMQRLAVTSATTGAVWCRGYYLPTGRAVALKYVDTMLRGTHIELAGDLKTSKLPRASHSTTLRFVPGTVMDIAVKEACAGRPVAAVNAASAYHVGGGCLTGGRHALEEAWCVTSTLLKSLQQAQFMQLEAEDEGEGLAAAGHSRLEVFHRYLPEDGVVVSPMVEVFRESYQQGYAFMADPVSLCGVVSVAMYNRNPRMKDSPVDAPEKLDEYTEGVRKKFLAAVAGAIGTGAEVLIIPDVGCGVFGNDPVLVGTVLGQVLRDKPLKGRLKEVQITGNETFADAAHRAFNGLPPPASADGELRADASGRSVDKVGGRRDRGGECGPAPGPCTVS